MVLRRLICLSAIAPFLASAPLANAQYVPPGPVPAAARWGVADDHIVTSAPSMQRMRDAGFGWVRYTVFWNLANPAENAYFWDNLDAEVDNMTAAGLNVFMLVQWAPTWARVGPITHPNDQAVFYCYDPAQSPDPYKVNDPNCNQDRHPRPDAVRTFATALATRYKGRVAAYGFGTEVHSRVFWQGSTIGNVARDQFVDDLLRPAYEAIKSADPSALVVGPDVDRTDELEGVLQREALRGVRLFDVIAFHALRHGGWSDPSQFDNEWLPGNRSLKNVMELYGRGRPLWIAELGYQATSAERPAQAAWLDLFLKGITARPWIDKAFVYRMRNDTANDFGLIEADGVDTPTQAYWTTAAYFGTMSLPKFYYLAEGAAGSFFDMDIAIANPNATAAPMKATFLKKDGTVLVMSPTLGAQTRSTIRYEVDVDPSTFSEVSTVVESTTGASLAVERTLFWDNAYYSGHTGGAVSAPARTWYFGEGFQGSFDTFVLLANATPSTAHVTITFLRETGTPVVYPVTVAANSRQTVWAVEPTETCATAPCPPALVNQAFAIRVDADVPIIAERSMYFNAGGLFWGAGHESAGVSALSPTWFLAEGSTGSFTDTYILVGNPSAQDADVTFTFLIGAAGVPPVVATTRVAASKRFTLDAENAYQNLVTHGGALTLVSGDINVLRDAPFSTKVEATNGTPIVVERAMYWPGGFDTWAEAHNSFGVTETGVKWALAEGRSGRGRGFETYILVANPMPQPAQVTVTFLKPTGQPIVKHYTIDPTSRFNIAVPNDVPELPDHEFSAVVESTNGVEIVVERAMYWNGPGSSFWAGGSNATAVKLQ